MPKRKFWWWWRIKTGLLTYPRDADRERKAAIDRAIVRLAKKPEGDAILKLANLVYFRKEYTINGAAMKIGISERTASRYVNHIFFTIAEEMSFLPKQ